jgi:hypothetical protein
MNKCFIFSGCGIGDHFIINGIVNVYSEMFQEVYLSCEPQKLNFLTSLYKENTKVIPVPLQYAHTSKTDELKNFILDKYFLNLHLVDQGIHHNPTYQHKMYSLAKLPFEVKYSHFKLPFNPNSINLYNQIIKHDSYCLINNICSAGKFDYPVNSNLPKYYLEPGITENILDFQTIIEKATEIHTLDTSFYHFIDNLNLQAKLYHHHVRHPKDINWDIYISPKWIQIDNR